MTVPRPCNWLFLTLSVILLGALCFAAPSPQVSLTLEERQWLKDHPVIRLAPDPDFKPIEYFDAKGGYQGAAADIIRILEKKLGITVTIVQLKNWDEAMERFKAHEVDMLGAMVRTPNREKFALFTDTLVSVPGGIFTTNKQLNGLTLDSLKGMKVAVVSNYAAHDIIKNRYPETELHVVPDVSTGLAKAALGMVDVYVENMANATYYAQEAGITNLHLAGKTEFDYKWGIGIRKDWPMLQGILNKGLGAITDHEREQAMNRWIFVEGQQWRPSKTFIAVAAASLLAFMLLFFCYWNLRLKKVVRERTESLQNELEERQKAEKGLKTLAAQLEQRVAERTMDLEKEIAQRALSEQAALASGKLFRELFNNLADPVYISDMHGRFLSVNDQACSEVGYTTDELLRMTVADVDVVSPAGEFEHIHGEYPPGTTRILETRHRKKDGTFIEVEVKVRLIEFDGQPAVMGTARNISARKHAEEALRDSEHKFRTLFNTIQDAVFLTSIDGTIIECNEKLSGYGRDELLGRSSDEFLLWTDPRDRQRLIEAVTAKGFVNDFEAALGRKDGSTFPGSVSSNVLMLGDQKHFLSVVRDITERKNAEAERAGIEQQMLHAQKLESLGVLAGGIAHDFNNILTAIVGNAELAVMRLNPESPAIENLKRIENASARAADLAKQMLAYSGKGKFVIESIDLNRLIREMGHMLEVSISKRAALRYELTSPLPAVEVDATQIRQIIMNLVINASEAMGDKDGVISISTGCVECSESYLREVWLADRIPGGSYVYFEISDTGCGMNKETLAKIFDPFFTTKFTGRGLGMAAVLGIIRGHKGAIKVYSEESKGSSFKILLPAGERPAELRDEALHDEQWKGAGVALLVDDEETILDIGSEMLRELGFEVVTAPDGERALQVYGSGDDISVVVLDLTMPHMDGEQCFRELRLMNPQVKVIMSSGFSEHEVTQKFAGKGLAGFVQKPYKLSSLRNALRGIE